MHDIKTTYNEVVTQIALGLMLPVECLDWITERIMMRIEPLIDKTAKVRQPDKILADKLCPKNKDLPITRVVKPRMLSVRESAEYLGIAEKTLRNRLGSKADNPFPVKPKHIGGKVLFDVRDLDAYLDELPTT